MPAKQLSLISWKDTDEKLIHALTHEIGMLQIEKGFLLSKLGELQAHSASVERVSAVVISCEFRHPPPDTLLPQS